MLDAGCWKLATESTEKEVEGMLEHTIPGLKEVTRNVPGSATSRNRDCCVYRI